MRIQILCIGESKAFYLKEGEQDYINRLTHYIPLRLNRIQPVKHMRSKSADQIRKEESDALLKKIRPDAYVVALDAAGKALSSEAFANQLSVWQNQGRKEIVFVIGGPLGIHASLLNHADRILSLSRMTFTHDMVRLILLEQIYRAFTILRGEQYHK